MRQILVGTLLVLVFTSLMAETVTLSPTDDMYTDAEHSGDQPDVTQLWTANYTPAGHFERIMMRFDLDPYAGYELVSATLHMTRLYSCPSGGTTASMFYAIGQEWDEETWDHTTHISYSETVSMPYVFSGAGGTTNVAFNVDVTDFIDNWFTLGIPNYGFVIMANSGQKFSKFYSKEHGNESLRPTLTLEYNEVGVEDGDAPVPAIVASNYPNPFNPETTILYSVAASSRVCIDIYNVKGQRVRRLLDTHVSAGEHQVLWDGRDDGDRALSGGVYLYHVATNNDEIVKPMVMLK